MAENFQAPAPALDVKQAQQSAVHRRRLSWRRRSSTLWPRLVRPATFATEPRARPVVARAPGPWNDRPRAQSLRRRSQSDRAATTGSGRADARPVGDPTIAGEDRSGLARLISLRERRTLGRFKLPRHTRTTIVFGRGCPRQEKRCLPTRPTKNVRRGGPPGVDWVGLIF